MSLSHPPEAAVDRELSRTELARNVLVLVHQIFEGRHSLDLRILKDGKVYNVRLPLGVFRLVREAMAEVERAAKPPRPPKAPPRPAPAPAPSGPVFGRPPPASFIAMQSHHPPQQEK